MMKAYVQKVHTMIQNLEKPVSLLLQKGIVFSFLLCLFASFLLVGYISSFAEPILFYIGFSLFKSGLLFGALFFIFAIAFDGIVKQIV